MTNSEYERLYRAARKNFSNLTLSSAKTIKKIYLQAARDVAKVVRNAELAGYSQITIDSWNNILYQLQKSASDISIIIDKSAKDSISKAITNTSTVNERYLTDVFKGSGTELVTQAGIENMYTITNELLLQDVVTRLFSDGYTLSERVWKIGARFQEDIKNVISAGLAQNRDLIKIARDIQVYTKDGKIALAKRYGELLRPTRAFMRRIGNTVDWRALRLVRSELYASIQNAAREQGHINPNCTDYYEWFLTAGRQHWECECETIASRSPYKYEDVPGFPHPNCRCYIRPVLGPRKEFEADVLKWVRGGDVPYMQNWYNNFYIPNAG